MALVKCKECGNEISKKAKKCPSCGAPQRRTSGFTKFVLVLFIIGVGGAILASKQKPDYSAHTAKVLAQSAPTKPANQPKSSWTTFSSRDEMTGEASHYANSPKAYPSRKMRFPYANVDARLSVGCDGKNEWVYFGFNDNPNLANTKTKSGYNLIRTRIKWDDAVESVNLTQDWSSKFIHFQVDGPALSKIQAANTALLELQWHGEQPVFFEFSLNGSSKALKEIRKKCNQQ